MARADISDATKVGLFLGAGFLVLGGVALIVVPFATPHKVRIPGVLWGSVAGMVVLGALGVGQAIGKIGLEDAVGLLRSPDTEPRAAALAGSWALLLIAALQFGLGWGDPDFWRSDVPKGPHGRGPQWAAASCFLLLGLGGLWFAPKRGKNGGTG